MIYQQKISNLFSSNVNIDINRSLRLKSISMTISNECIKIKAPFFLSNKKINDLLKKKFHWIKKQLNIQQNIKPLIKKIYLDGEEFLYLGKLYVLKIIIGQKYSITIEGDLFIVSVKDVNNTLKIKRIVNKWFHEKSFSYFKEKTLFYAKENNLNITSVKVREYKSRWGSCSIGGDITFNWRLIMAPPEVIKYVVIHELVHLIEHNHSPKYWKHVKSIYPNVDGAKKWLKYNGKTLSID